MAAKTKKTIDISAEAPTGDAHRRSAHIGGHANDLHRALELVGRHKPGRKKTFEEATTRINFLIPISLARKLKAAAAIQGRTISDLAAEWVASLPD